ncbi:MAG: hypothetical protein HYV01_12825 [Deltaproteobacteria bacterium]|nr:hypothetical protein [Deltaproteobacteria bacterium]
MDVPTLPVDRTTIFAESRVTAVEDGNATENAPEERLWARFARLGGWLDVTLTSRLLHSIPASAR